MRKALVVLALAGTLGLGAAAPASALAPPVLDCSLHGVLTKSYTAAELKNALNTMPAESQEYSDCHNVIQRALLAKIGHLSGGGGAGGGGGSFLPIWLIVVIALLVLGGLGFAVVAARNRGQGSVSG